MLIMGRTPRLAVDLNSRTNLPEHGPASSSRYVLDLQRRLNWAHNVAMKQIEKEALKAKKYYDRRVRWEHDVYEV